MSAHKTKADDARRRPQPPPAPADDLRRAGRIAEQTRRQAEQCAKLAGLPVRHEHAAGIDVGDASHWACVEATPDGSDTVRAFPAHTAGLRQLVTWLKDCGVTTVALEASGVYGQVLFLTLLEAGFTAVLTAPSFTRPIKGRPKTDRRDCQWIQRLHTSTACCRRSSSPTTPPTRSATASASGPTWCGSPAGTSSGCRKPWS
jgi:hypothetical protein